LQVDDERTLIELARSGNAEAFGELVNIYGDMIYGLSLKLTRDITAAQDLAQDVFMNAFKKIGGFKDKAKFATWLYRITVNLWIDKCRKNKSRKTLPLAESKDDYEPHIASSMADAETLAQQKEFSDILWKGLDILPLHEKIVVILNVYEGRSYKEIGQICGCSAGTVGSRYSRAVEKLRRYFNSKDKER
jgi:RNA polymerase sigma-70 factor (ECF subfamily)